MPLTTSARRTAFAALLAPLAAALPQTVAAQTYEAVNRLTVVPLNPHDFEVIESRGEGARGLWCAAADYVDSLRPAQRTGDLYVKRARGPSVSGAGRIGVTFTLDPARLNVEPNSGYSVTVRQEGRRLPVQHAFRFCRDLDWNVNDILYRPRF